MRLSRFWLEISLLVTPMAGVSGSCAPEHDDTRGEVLTLAADFLRHYDEFAQHYGHSVRNVGARLAKSLDGDALTVGQCWSWSNGDLEIVVLESWWLHSTEIEREIVVFHELGHCVLQRDHSTVMIDFAQRSVPESIMYPIILTPALYRARRLDYLLELFEGGSR